jgi:hypothetical protein
VNDLKSLCYCQFTLLLTPQFYKKSAVILCPIWKTKYLHFIRASNEGVQTGLVGRMSFTNPVVPVNVLASLPPDVNLDLKEFHFKIGHMSLGQNQPAVPRMFHMSLSAAVFMTNWEVSC